jgi:hypothetical protein
MLAYNLQNPPVNWKQGQVPEEMFQTLLTNKNQRNMTKYTPLISLRQPYFAFTERNVFIIGKSPTKLKTGRDPYL